MKIKRALISVWDKTNIIDLGNFLSDQKIEIISTGGTKKVLEESGLIVRGIDEITGIGSVMDGRVKTLNPIIIWRYTS
jgi:AICAR transformylase/IMP cyclohydrolase PurH (only IMP cyclohydrolase domain in Aful)